MREKTRVEENKMSSAETALIKEEDKSVAESDRRENHVFEKDTKYSWFVCACAFFTQVFVLGVLHAYGVFFVEFVKDFGTSKGSTAWVGSLAYGLSMTFSPVTSQLLVRYSYSRVMMIGGGFCVFSLIVSSFMTSLTVLYVTFSIFYGIGTCMATAPTMTITPEHFDKYMSIATGITVSGSSFGTLIMGPLSQFIIDLAGWRVAFRVFSGFIVITIVLNSMIRTPPSVTKRKMEGHNFIKDLQIWKNKVFVVWTIAITLVMFGFYIPYVHLVSYAIGRGIEPDMASLLMMVLGSATAVGRIMFGKIVQHGVLHRLHMHQMSMVITGTGVMVLPLIKSYAGIVIYVIIVGLVDGCFVVLLPIMTASLMGLEKSVLAWGFLIGTCSITFTLGPPVAGALYDATGTYNVAFHCAGIPIVSGAVILFLIPWAQRTSKSTNAMGFLSQEITVQVSRQDMSAQSPERAVPISVGSMTNVSVQTVGSSSLLFEDKSTSTEDVSLHLISPYVAERLSQLSYSGQMFEHMLRMSMSISTEPEEISKLPPPSGQARRRYVADDQHSAGSSLQSYPDELWSPSDLAGYFDSVSLEFLQSLPSPKDQPPIDHKEKPGSTRSALASQLQKQTPSKHAEYASTDLGSIHSAPSMGNTDVSPSSSKHTHVSWPRATPVLQDRTAHSARNYFVPNMSSLAEKGCSSKQASSFDETISNHVNMLKSNLTSPMSSSSRIQDACATKENPDTSSEHSNVSDNIDITATGTTNLVPESSNPYLNEEPMLSLSDLIREAMIPIDLAVSDSNLPSGSTEFARENELTVVPANNPFVTKKYSINPNLGDLFKSTEPEATEEKAYSSYELVDSLSDDDASGNLAVQKSRSTSSELDVFTHLFDDDVNNGDKKNLYDDGANNDDGQN